MTLKLASETDIFLLASTEAETDSPADFTTAAALTGPIFDLWNSPEEDAAWEHLTVQE